MGFFLNWHSFSWAQNALQRLNEQQRQHEEQSFGKPLPDPQWLLPYDDLNLACWPTD